MDEINNESQEEIEKKIAENDYINSISPILNNAYNEGYLSTCERKIEEKYSEGFEKGKEYSYSFGKLLGEVEFLLFVSSNTLSSEEEKDALRLIKEELETFASPITEGVITKFKSRISKIKTKYIKLS